MPASAIEFEQVLRDFSQIARRVDSSSGADAPQRWQFVWNGRDYLLYFYPRGGAVRRLFRRNPAHQHFFNLQTLQKLKIPSPRTLAQLAGFRLGGAIGDAVIVEHESGATTLEALLADHDRRAAPLPMRRDIESQVCAILKSLGSARLTHSDLTLASFSVHDGRVRLDDARPVRRGGMRMRDVMRFAHSAARFATIGEMRRTWNALQPGVEPPNSNAYSRRLWARELRSIRRDGATCEAFRVGTWGGLFTKRTNLAPRHSRAGTLDIRAEDWQRAWPTLLAQIDADQLAVLKRDTSGDVLAGEVLLAGRSISIVVKRPRNKFWYRYLLDLFRASRATRMWVKTWKVIVRNQPTEWPMLIMYQRVLGHVADAIVVFERVEGTTLSQLDLDTLSADERDTLFRRAGRTLRQLERAGLAHMDAKSTNWIVVPDPFRGPTPVLIDLFGIRVNNFFRFATGIRRLLRAMRLNPRYTPDDSLSLCHGYAPYSRVHVEQPEHDTDPAA